MDSDINKRTDIGIYMCTYMYTYIYICMEGGRDRSFPEANKFDIRIHGISGNMNPTQPWMKAPSSQTGLAQVPDPN